MTHAKDIARVWRIPEFGGIDFLCAEYGRHSFAPHSHEEYMLGVVESGIEGVRYRRETVYAPAGNLLTVNPGEIHTGYPARATTWKYRALYPSVSGVREIATEVGFKSQLPYFRGVTFVDSSLARMLAAMHYSVEQGASALERESIILRALTALFVRHADFRPASTAVRREHRAVNRTREALEARFADDVSLRELSDLSGLSRFHLIRVFRRETGLSPHQFQTLLRVRRARQLLLDGRSPETVALDVGFYDQSHLIRQFTRVFGVTPGRYSASSSGQHCKS